MKKFPLRFSITILLTLAIAVSIVWIMDTPDRPAGIQSVDWKPIAKAPSHGLNTPIQNNRAHSYTAAKTADVSKLLNKKKPVNFPKVTMDEAKKTGSQIAAFFKNKKDQLQNASPMRTTPRGVGRQVANPAQQEAIDEVLDTLGSDSVLHMDSLSRTLKYLEGDLSLLVDNSENYYNASQRNDFPGMAAALADELKIVMNLNDPVNELSLDRVRHDDLGMTHVIMQQEYEGIPIWGAQVGFHFSEEKKPVRISGVYAPSPVSIPAIQYNITEGAAIQEARKAVNAVGSGYLAPHVEKMFYWDIDRAPVLSYRVELTPAIHQHWHVFVSADEGKVIHVNKDICAAAATGQATDLNGVNQTVNSWELENVYYMVDTSRPMYDPSSQPPDINNTKGAVVVLDAQNQILEEAETFYIVTSQNPNQWDPTAVSVLNHFGIVENYYRRTFARNSIDDKGMNILGIIHVRFKAPDGSVYNDNAFWNPGAQLMVFGDGEQQYQDLPASLDVAGHELTHGVINHSANLIYENQSGALNEHVADFFGAMIDRDEWLLADGVVIGKDALRDMKDPHNPNIASQQPMNMSEFQNLPNTPQTDNGGVHVNSGIPNHATYLLTDGPTGVGHDKAEKIIYRALLEYLTQRSQFIDYRRSCVASAKDLYGDGSAEVEAVKNAFDGVQIYDQGGGDTTPAPAPSTPGLPTDGHEQIVFLVGDPNAGVDTYHNDYYYQLVLNDQGQNGLITLRYVYNTRAAISGNGEWGLYVSVDHNIYWTDGSTEEQITDTNNSRTISMSKNRRYIAYTTTNFDNYIFVIDTETGEERSAQLFVTRMDGVTQDLAYADILTFNFRGDTLIYDAVFLQKLSNGEELPVWGVYSLRIADLVSQQIVPQAPGEQIGNPSFAHTSDHLLLADYLLTENNQTSVAMMAVDFSQNQMAILMEMNDFAHPSLRGGDQTVVYKGYNPNGQTWGLLDGQIDQTSLALNTNSLQVLFEAIAPISYPIGFRVGEFTEQQGQINVPASIVFGDVPTGQMGEQTVSITNQGNADLQILGITIKGDSTAEYGHNGANETIPPNVQYNFQVGCIPNQAGPFNAVMRIQSTDPDHAEVTINLNGVGVQAGPEPTTIPTTPPTQPTSTPLPEPTTTPVPGDTPTPSPTPVSTDRNWITYEFDQSTLAADGWSEIPGGFTSADPGSINSGPFFGNPIPSSADNKGLAISVQSGQVAFVYASAPINTGGNPALMRLTFYANVADASITLAALQGSMTATNASLATNMPKTAANFMNGESVLTLVYEPDEGELITPIIQVAGIGENSAVTVLVDRLEVLPLDPAQSYEGNLLASKVNNGQAGDSVTYEFDQAPLASSGWAEIPGGFVPGTVAGSINPISFFGMPIPSSADNKGLAITVQERQVAFAYALQPVNTGGNPVLLRLTLKASAKDATVALAALQGSMTATNESLATHIPSTAISFIENERVLVLLYEPDEGKSITPLIQVAGAGQTDPVTAMVDKLEVIPLSPTGIYAGSLFYSAPTGASPEQPEPGTISEQEPNNTLAQSQNLGDLNLGESIDVSGQISQGGIYTGDNDWFSINLTSQATLKGSLDWTGGADLDLAIYRQNGSFIQSYETADKPVTFEQLLDAGAYLIVVVSKNSAADYQFGIAAEP